MIKLVAFGAVVFFTHTFAANVDCSKELILAYFPEPFVNLALEKYHVDKDHWASINKELAAKDEAVLSIVEQKASKMDPNPLQDPKQRPVAVKLFRETLFQVFSDVLYANGVTDSEKVQDMLDEIQQQKAEHFALCMKNQKGDSYTPSKSDDDFEFEE